MEDDDEIEIPAWMEYKEDEKLEHYARLVDPPSPPRPADYLAGLAYTILGTKP